MASGDAANGRLSEVANKTQPVDRQGDLAAVARRQGAAELALICSPPATKAGALRARRHRLDRAR
jgi:hypothetical protein